MFKKILVVGAVGMIFVNSAIFAVQPEANQQIMLPITAGTITLQNSDFDSQGNATIHINNFGPGSCPSPYVSPAAKYPWIMAYPSAYQVGHDVTTPNIRLSCQGEPYDICDLPNTLPKPVFNLSIMPVCDATSCNIKVAFQYLSYHSVTPASQDTCTWWSSKWANHCIDPFGRSFTNGYLTITYIAYCSTQPIQSDAGKHESEPAK